MARAVPTINQQDTLSKFNNRAAKAVVVIAATVVTILANTSCAKMFIDDDPSADPISTFNYLWKQVDNQYSLFDVKAVDWQTVYDTTAPKIKEQMSNEALFNVLAEMLNCLDDGHVNLISPFNVSRCTNLYKRMQEGHNYNADIVRERYLRYDYHTTGGFAHQTHRADSVVYVRYSSFSNSASVAQWNYVLNLHPKAKGVVLDLRQNGGGEVQNVWNLLSLLSPPTHYLYDTQIKSGPNRDDFTALKRVYPPKNESSYSTYTKPIVVLTDRGCYSASSFFILCAKQYPNVTVIGDTTGGGLGLPNGGELPNGWRYRLSTTRTIAHDGVNYENGVPPHEIVHLSATAVASGEDNIIEHAFNIILQH